MVLNTYRKMILLGTYWDGTSYQDADHSIIINRIQSVSGIFCNLLVVSVFWKVQIQLYIASDPTDGKIRCMYKAVKKTKVIRRYM